MNIVFFGSQAIQPPANSVVVADEFDFGRMLSLDKSAVGVFMCKSKAYGRALVQNLRVDGIKNPLYCMMWGEEADHTMIAAILDAGADQVEKFPVHTDLFNAQIEAIVRRGAGNPDPIIRFGGMEFDQSVRLLTKDGTVIHLSELEANIFYAVAGAQGATMTKEQIADVVYGHDNDQASMKVVDVVICKLRKKMMKISGGLDFIMTVWGYGYAFREEGFQPNIRKTVNGTQRFVTERGPIRGRQRRHEEAAE